MFRRLLVLLPTKQETLHFLTKEEPLFCPEIMVLPTEKGSYLLFSHNFFSSMFNTSISDFSHHFLCQMSLNEGNVPKSDLLPDFDTVATLFQSLNIMNTIE